MALLLSNKRLAQIVDTLTICLLYLQLHSILEDSNIMTQHNDLEKLPIWLPIYPAGAETATKLLFWFIQMVIHVTVHCDLLLLHKYSEKLWSPSWIVVHCGPWGILCQIICICSTNQCILYQQISIRHWTFLKYSFESLLFLKQPAQASDWELLVTNNTPIWPVNQNTPAVQCNNTY